MFIAVLRVWHARILYAELAVAAGSSGEAVVQKGFKSKDIVPEDDSIPELPIVTDKEGLHLGTGAV
ncbi:hypothetical protein DSO57_1015723 [Entomophthora muscae]|uniref:Uncharacterized protein n=1 Tax=Entomophthora muscae TaxID=34485 RepID=A0ACC2RW57_9FUNG|nr:hypothetical protein DSO57_1015723 [Entomophthora muscae]